MDKITQQQYDELKEAYRNEKGYDDMSEDEQRKFDDKLDKAMDSLYEVRESSGGSDDSDISDEEEKTDSVDKMQVSNDEMEQMKDEVRERNGYADMTEDEQEEFDGKLNQYCDNRFEIIDDKNENDKTDENENSHEKKLIR